MQNVDVQNPDVSGLKDKHTPSPTSDSISRPLYLCFVIPVPEVGRECLPSPCWLRTPSSLGAAGSQCPSCAVLVHAGAELRRSAAAGLLSQP